MGGGPMGGGGPMAPMGGGGGGQAPPVSAMAAAPDFNPHKIFVGGIPHSVDEQSFSNYFQQFGIIAESWLMYDPSNQRPRGFGFVVFQDADALERCLQRGRNHELHNKFIDVKRATPRAMSAPPQRPMGGGGGGMGGGGGGMMMNGGAGGGGGGGMGMPGKQLPGAHGPRARARLMLHACLCVCARTRARVSFPLTSHP